MFLRIFARKSQYERQKHKGKNETNQYDDCCVADGSSNYQLCKPVSLWLRGENLLAQRYEIIAGYPMPRATFMGGASIRF